MQQLKKITIRAMKAHSSAGTRHWGGGCPLPEVTCIENHRKGFPTLDHAEVVPEPRA